MVATRGSTVLFCDASCWIYFIFRVLRQQVKTIRTFLVECALKQNTKKHTSVHLDAPKEIKNGGFTLKTHQMFSVHTTLEELKTQQSTLILDLCLTKTHSRKSRDYRDVIVFVKLCFQNVSRSHENEKPPLSNCSGLNSGIEKLRFRDGLVWTVGHTKSLTGWISTLSKPPFSNSSGVVWTVS